MAPVGGGKRKRGDRNNDGESRDDGSRPSPHRPDKLTLAQRSQPPPQQPSSHTRGGYGDRGRGGRRGGRAGHSAGSQRSPVQSPTSKSQVLHDADASVPNVSPKVSKKDSVAQAEVQSKAEAVADVEKDKEENRPPPPLLPYYFEYLTEPVVAQWEQTGRAQVLEEARRMIDTQDDLSLSTIFQELIRASVDSTLDPQKCGSVVRDIFPDEEIPLISKPASEITITFDPVSIFLDTLSIFGEGGAVYPPMRPMIEATQIPMKRLIFQLDGLLLGKLGFVRVEGGGSFKKRTSRYVTNALYRQACFSLLREESEGYSKLVTEYFTTSNNEPPTSEVVKNTFERVKGMIGAFDLYVGRVLDITLDVFAAVLVKQYRFFVKYLRVSSWWPEDNFSKQIDAQNCLGPLPRWALPGFEGRALTDDERRETEDLQSERDTKFWQRCRQIGTRAFFELGGRQTDEQSLQAVMGDSKDADAAETKKWIEVTRTLPPSGNNVAAQILGYKLRFYSSHIRDPSDTLPVNLIYLSALLIKVGFISIADLFTHLWPDDTGMESIKEDKLKEKTERERQSRPGGGTNALLAAAPLPDDTLDAPMRDVARLREAEASKRQQKAEASDRGTPAVSGEDKSEVPEPTEQKIQLLKSLLAIGAVPEALYMLGRYSWLLDVLPDLPEYIHRILHHCLTKVYEPLRPLRDEDGLRRPQSIPDNDQTGVTKGSIKFTDLPARRTLRWAQLDRDDTTESVDYRFYWEDWADIIPVCQDVDDVFTLCNSLLNLSGVKIGQDPTLLDKLARIGCHSLDTDPSESNRKRWIDLSKRLLVPSLSFVKCSPGTVNEVFQLLKHFSAPTRYNLYAEWHSGQTSRLPDIRSAFEQTKLETRDVLKRISKENIKQMARALAKVAYSSPTVVFSVAISQLESYENLVDTFVECVRYFTHLAYDVLTWSLMSSLGAQGRNRLQADGLLTSKWLASLALFSGRVFKRYQDINPLPIIQYVEHQLRQGNPTDLIVLEDIIRSMAGIVSDVNYNEAQVLAMSGGDLLQSQTLLQLLDRRHESSKESRRLVGPLKEKRIAGQVLVSLAQERQMGIFRVEEENAHPKLLGNLLDQMHRILGQYLELLRTNLSIDEFNNFVPGVSELVASFGIDPSIAFWLSRQSINAAIDKYDEDQSRMEVIELKDSTNEVDELGSSKPEADLSANANGESDSMEIVPTVEVEGLQAESDAAVDGSQNLDTNGDVEMKSEVPETSQSAEDSQSKTAPSTQSCHPVLREVADNVQAALPSEMWDALNPSFFVTFWHLSLSDIHVPVQQYDDEVKKLSEKTKNISQDRTDISVAGTERKRQEKKVIENLISNLLAEMKKRMLLKQVPRLRKEKNDWFSGPSTFNDRHVALIEHCFFPRLIMSPFDSHYTFRMIKWLHKEAAANFRTVGVYDQFFREKRLTSMIFLCSSKEAECLGRFINDVLRDFCQWHADKKVYEKEAHGPKKNLPGFARKGKTADGVEEDVFLPYEDFRRLLMKWHRNINGALKNCYASGEYMHIRNAINILNNIYSYFPAVNWMGSNQLSSITELSTKEKREDLKIAAMSLIGALKKREKHWVLPQAFNLNDGNQAANRGRGNSAKPPASAESEATKTLNPQAAEFKPGSQISVNGDTATSKAASSTADAEDGEIDDAQAGSGGAKTDPKPGDSKTNAPDKNELPTPKQTDVPTQAAETLDRTRATPGTKPDVPTSSPVTKPASMPSRPEVPRTRSSNTSSGQHDLPTKPDPTPYRHSSLRNPAQVDARPSAPHDRDNRGAGRSSMDGVREPPRGSDRLANGPPARGAPVDSRLPRPGLEDTTGRSNRDVRSSMIDDRSNRLPNGRPSQEHDTARRDLITGQRDREPAAPASGSNITQHPDRAALIQGQGAPDREAAGRFQSDRQAYGGPERRSRGPSPSRADHRGPTYERNEPPMNPRPPYDTRPNHPAYSDSPAPTGPRGERPPVPPPSHSNDRFRENVRGPHQPSAPVDMQYGRLRQEPHRHQQSESFGRLSQDHDPPAGPRMPNGNAQTAPRGGRNASMNTPASSSQPPMTSAQYAPPPQDRQAPSGPSARPSTRSQAPPAQATPAPNATSAQDTETAGIHPDRLKAMQGSGPPIASRTGPAIRQSDRLPPSPVSSQTPEIPRNTHDQMAGMAAGRGPPTAPADRRSDKRFTGLHSVLQQSNNQPTPERANQGTSIRGRGARANAGPSPSSSSGPSTPNSSFPPTDAFGGRSAAPPPAMGPEEDARYGRGSRHAPHEAERRSTRQRSRSAGRGRGQDLRHSYDGTMPPPREDPRDRFRNDGPAANMRGNPDAGPRGGGPPPMDRELRGGPPRRGGRDEVPPREPDRRDNQDWSGDRRGGMGRRGEDRDARDGGGSLRKRGRMEDGYADRAALESKRPRR